MFKFWYYQKYFNIINFGLVNKLKTEPDLVKINFLNNMKCIITYFKYLNSLIQ